MKKPSGLDAWFPEPPKFTKKQWAALTELEQLLEGNQPAFQPNFFGINRIGTVYTGVIYPPPMNYGTEDDQ